MRLVFFGSSLVSAYWNGAATYYRGLCKAMHARGHEIRFVEPDIYDRQAHRDLIEDPPYAEVRVCRGWDDLARELRLADGAELVAKCSGVGGWELELARGVVDLRSPSTLVGYVDVDAPQTLGAAFAEPPGAGGFRDLIPRFDLIVLYGGGRPVQDAYARLGARATHLVCNAVDPDDYYPVAPVTERRCDLLFVGSRLPDREARVREFFLRAAELAPELSFCLGGPGWGEGIALPPNVRWIGYVPTAEHRGWNCSARMVLNVDRQAMAEYGFSPPTRVFEAAGCGACLITDAWVGVDAFFEPGRELLVAGSAEQVVEHLRSTTLDQSRAIGLNARARVLRDHTYAGRAATLEAALDEALGAPAGRIGVGR